MSLPLVDTGLAKNVQVWLKQECTTMAMIEEDFLLSVTPKHVYNANWVQREGSVKDEASKRK